MIVFYNNTILNYVFSDEKLWFNINDIAKILNYNNGDTIRKTVSNDQKSRLKDLISDSEKLHSSERNAYYIDESGLKTSLKKCKNKNKLGFEKWLSNNFYLLLFNDIKVDIICNNKDCWFKRLDVARNIGYHISKKDILKVMGC